MPALICDNLSVSPEGRLLFAGLDTTALAKTYGTPLYLLDGDRVRQNCRMYQTAMRDGFPAGSRPLYAGKALAFRKLYEILKEEDMGIDVVSCGEIYTAYAAGYDLSNACFHGNNKTDDDLRFALDHGVGVICVDNLPELFALEAILAERNATAAETAARPFRQQILLRITPGIDPHTYAAVNTGMVDSKFGAAIETGQAEELVLAALSLKYVEVAGYHCHVGSQVFGEDVFERAAEVMLRFAKDMQEKTGLVCRILDLGGGYGVRYVASDPEIDIAARLKGLGACILKICGDLALTPPAIRLEPGRSIVADAGMTLYTVGGVKKIPGYKTYVSVDGGMADNPRYALYRSSYTCLVPEKMNEETSMTCSVVGRLCESGDILQENVPMPASIARGDLLAVCTTGAYNYAMASHYNRLPKPPIVLIEQGQASVAVRRETFEDLLKTEL